MYTELEATPAILPFPIGMPGFDVGGIFDT
jgi:hypothetical protein